MAQNQNKFQNENKGSGGGDGPETPESLQKERNVEGTLAASDDTIAECQVVYGASDISVNVAGLSVMELQDVVKDALNLDPTAEAYINGKLVPDKHTILQPGQRIEFVKESGQKGRMHFCSV